jgi:hypothetical protein
MHPNNLILRERVPPAGQPFPETYGLAGHACGNPSAKWREMFNDELKRPAKVARLMADLHNAKGELLSAQCAVDRLRIHYPIPYIVSFGERRTLERALASARALSGFFGEIESQLKVQERKE